MLFLFFTFLAMIQIRNSITTDQSNILQKINDFREEIRTGGIVQCADGACPKGYDNVALTWSDDLATGAAESALACNQNHVQPDSIGENNAWYTTSSFEAAANWAVTYWGDESKFVSASDIAQFKGVGSASHFTEMVSHNDKEVGCAFNPSCSFGYFVVCRFFPRGNFWDGKPLYDTTGSGTVSSGVSTTPREIVTPVEITTTTESNIQTLTTNIIYNTETTGSNIQTLTTNTIKNTETTENAETTESTIPTDCKGFRCDKARRNKERSFAQQSGNNALWNNGLPFQGNGYDKADKLPANAKLQQIIQLLAKIQKNLK